MNGSVALKLCDAAEAKAGKEGGDRQIVSQRLRKALQRVSVGGAAAFYI